jgi:hypothetical protein
MANSTFSDLIDGNSDIKTTLSLLSFNEDDAHIIYSPALDLAGYGTSEEEAKESFQVVLEEFIGHCLKNKTFLIELKRLGWHITALSEEIEKTNERIQELIRLLPESGDETYRKIRRLQLVREIMLEQKRNMEEVLRRQ